MDLRAKKTVKSVRKVQGVDLRANFARKSVLRVHSMDLRARRCPVGAGHDGEEIPDQVRDEGKGTSLG